MFRTDLNEVNVDAIDLGDELREGVELRLALAPVVLRPPIARELLDRRELNTLRCIRDDFAFGPLGRLDAATQVGDLRIRNIHLERTNIAFISHGFQPPRKSEQTERSRSNGCRRSTGKAMSIEIGHF